MAIGPVDALKKLTPAQLGLSQAAKTGMANAFYKARPLFSAIRQAISTVGGAGTTDGMPRIFLGFKAFTELGEVLAHELIHSGGFKRDPSASNDLDYMGTGYDNIIEECAD